MTLSRRTALIAVDWGTTSARAYRVDGAGAVIDERDAPLGIQQVRGNYPAAFAALLGDWIHEPVPRLACGMIGSRQGWVEAPYVDCPATLDALAQRLTRSPDGALIIVPGLACRDGDGIPDVMRGEETQIFGALADEHAPSLVVLPGTHSKWAVARGASIDAFSTYMTGEVFAVLKEHSIIGRLLAPGAGRFAAAAFARGVHRALAPREPSGALLHELFGARTLALFGDLAPEDIADYLSGLLIGSEIRAGRDWAAQRGFAAARVTLIGTPALCARYVAAIGEAGIVAGEARADAAACGLWRIASRAGLVR